LAFILFAIWIILNIFDIHLFKSGNSLNVFIRIYIFLPEQLAELFFTSANASAVLENHALVFSDSDYYYRQYAHIIEDWTNFLLYKRWCILILAVICFTSAEWKKKIRFLLIFLLVHQLAIAGGLYLLGILLPKLYNTPSDTYLSPTLFGNLCMFILFSIWSIRNRQGLQLSLERLNIRIKLSRRTLREILLALFLFFILREFIVPFFPFKPYVNLLLMITKEIAGLFGFIGEIDGEELIGEYGLLGLSKHCLGFKTMYIFGSLVFLTRPSGKANTTWIFIFSGMTFLMVLNIARLAILFMIVQGPNGEQRANLHHEIYNVIIYIAIFLLWVLWYERFIRKKEKPGQT